MSAGVANRMPQWADDPSGIIQKKWRLIYASACLRLCISNLISEALDKAVAAGVSAVEIGVGGYPGSQHCRVDDLLAGAGERAFLNAIQSRGLLLQRPQRPQQPAPPRRGRGSAGRRGPAPGHSAGPGWALPVVNGSGCRQARRATQCPTGSPAPWPPEFLQMLDYQVERGRHSYWRELEPYAAEHGSKIA